MRIAIAILVVLGAACGGHHGGGDDTPDARNGDPGHPIIIGCDGCPDFPPLTGGGGRVAVTVGGAPGDLACVSGSNSRQISYAQEGLSGGIYSWQAVTQRGVAGTTGGIFRKDFGDPSPVSEPFLTPGTQNKCVGCHFLSRDGLRMTYGSDDADSDDEYGDLHVSLYDVDNRVALRTNLPAGFQTFTLDHLEFIGSDGVGQSATPKLTVYDGDAGTSLGAPLFGTLGTSRVANPDLSRD